MDGRNARSEATAVEFQVVSPVLGGPGRLRQRAPADDRPTSDAGKTVRLSINRAPRAATGVRSPPRVGGTAPVRVQVTAAAVTAYVTASSRQECVAFFKAGMCRVQHSRLVELPVVHTLGEKDTDFLEFGRPAAKVSSSTHCRNGSATTGHPSSIPISSRSQARSSSVVCGVIRSTIELGNVRDVSMKRASSSLRVSQTRVIASCNGAVPRQVVAAENGQRRTAVCPASVQPARDRLERQIRLFERVAALGDRHREDRKVGVGDLVRESGLVAGDKHVVDDAADDPSARLVAVALDQRVEVILRVEHARHPTVSIEQSDAADCPISTSLRQFVRVQRQMGAVEAADPDVQDARHERSPIVVRHDNPELTVEPDRDTVVVRLIDLADQSHCTSSCVDHLAERAEY
jgi:hypothetical protein